MRPGNDRKCGRKKPRVRRIGRASANFVASVPQPKCMPTVPSNHQWLSACVLLVACLPSSGRVNSPSCIRHVTLSGLLIQWKSCNPHDFFSS